LYTLCALFSFRTHLNFKCEALADLGSSQASFKSLDVYENLLAALQRLNKTETALVIP